MRNWKKCAAGIINWIAVILLGLVLGANLLRTSSVSYDNSELVTYRQSFEYLFSIPVIIVALVLTLILFKNQEAKKLYACFALMYIVAGLYLILNTGSFIRADASEVWEGAKDIGDGTPISVYIAMGTDIDNEVRGPGWWDKSTTNALAEANYDTDLATKNALVKLQNNIDKSISNPRKTGEFYWRIYFPFLFRNKKPIYVYVRFCNDSNVCL